MRLMQALSSMAEKLDAKPVLVTFDPHTLLVVRPDINLLCLTTLEEKLALTAVFGHIPEHIVIHFTPQVAQLSANDFLERLRADFQLRGMVVGIDFSLGHNRMGNIGFLQEYGQKYAIEVLPIQLEAIEQARISSTRIRTLVSEGKIEEAN